ncbi:MAG: hemolysin family protein [Oscillospiraceae bacterium]|nr:hemolysin family protein [Oscillospiraceae bacterium]
MDGVAVWQIVVLVLCLILCSYFSVSETALMSLSKIRLKHMIEENVKGVGRVERLIKNTNKLLATILVGNTVVNVTASSLATSIAINISTSYGVGIATGITTFLILVFGEITPKSLAAKNSEKVSLAVAPSLIVITYILLPIVKIITIFSNFFIKILGGNKYQTEPFITEDELKTMVNVSEEEGVLEEGEKKMIYNVFEFGDNLVKDIMVPRVDIVAIDYEERYEEVLKIIKEEQFSRFPIFKESMDDIIGVLNVKDILFASNISEDFSIDKYMREPIYTYEFKKISHLFNEMKRDRNHMAVVLDEYGGTVGIVTIEDLVEEIVGDISDEYDEDEDLGIKVIKEDEYLVNGSVRIDDLNDLIGTKMESEEFESIGGFILGILGRFPEKNEEVSFENMKFIIEEIDKNRIEKIRIYT